MPTTAHEIPLLVFRECPTLLVPLLRKVFRLPVPRFTSIKDKGTDFTRVVPVQLRADLVLIFYRGERPVLALIIEVQRRADRAKYHAWPGYVAALSQACQCPTYVLVVTDRTAVARWASRNNPYFQPNAPYRPLVLNPRDVPQVRTAEAARRAPELALLSLTVHGRDKGGEEVALAALQVAEEQGLDYTFICTSLIKQQLTAARQRRVEVKFGMTLADLYRTAENKKIRDSYLKGEAQGETKGKTEGKAEGKAEAILTVLSQRGLSVNQRLRRRVLSCKDLARLDRWLARAVTAATAAEALAD